MRKLLKYFLSTAAGSLSLASAEAQTPPPSGPRPPVPNPTERAEKRTDRIEAAFQNADLVANQLREQKIRGRLEGYLNSIGARPTPGEVHIFYVQGMMDGDAVVELRDFQYLTHGATPQDALRESFALEGAPGTEDRLYGASTGQRLVGIYITGSPEDGKFAFRGGTLTPEYYQNIRKQGLELREARRIEAIREDRIKNHAAGEPQAQAQLKRAQATPPLPPGPVTFPPEPPPHFPKVYSPPNLTSNSAAPPSPASAPMSVPPTLPRAHPPVKFDSTPGSGQVIQRQP